MRAPALHAAVAYRVGAGSASVESRRDANRRPAAGLAAGAWLAGLVLVAAAPVEAGMLDRVTLVGGVGHAVEKNPGRLSDLLPKTVDGVARDDRALLGSIMRGVEATPGHLIRDAFPVLSAGNAVARGLAAARRKLGRLAGRAGATVRDARSALVGRGEEEELLAGKPLAVPQLRVLALEAGHPSPGSAPVSARAAVGVWDADPPPGGTPESREHEAQVEDRPGPDAAGAGWREGRGEAEPGAEETPDDDYEAALQAMDAREAKILSRQREDPGQARMRDAEKAAVPDTHSGGFPFDAPAAGLPDDPGGTGGDDYGAALRAIRDEAETAPREGPQRTAAAPGASPVVEERPSVGTALATTGPSTGETIATVVGLVIQGIYAAQLIELIETPEDFARIAPELQTLLTQMLSGLTAADLAEGTDEGIALRVLTEAERGKLSGLLQEDDQLPEDTRVALLEAVGRTGANLEMEPLGPNWIVAENQPCQLYHLLPDPSKTATWSGGCVDGKAHGEGRAEWRSTDSAIWEEYVGSMRAGKYDGRGAATWARHGGGRYEGGFRDGMPHGRGVYTWSNGARYEGEVDNDRFHGKGVYTWADGDRDEGEFRDGALFNGLSISSDGARWEYSNGRIRQLD